MSSKPVAFANQGGGTQTTLGYDPDSETTPTLAKSQTVAVAYLIGDGDGRMDGGTQEGKAATDQTRGSPQAMAVRRLTPREAERLQGFPDDYTLTPYRGKPAADGPRYKALGNSMAVPCMKWLGERIQMVEGLLNE